MLDRFLVESPGHRSPAEVVAVDVPDVAAKPRGILPARAAGHQIQVIIPFVLDRTADLIRRQAHIGFSPKLPPPGLVRSKHLVIAFGFGHLRAILGLGEHLGHADFLVQSGGAGDMDEHLARSRLQGEANRFGCRLGCHGVAACDIDDHARPAVVIELAEFGGGLLFKLLGQPDLRALRAVGQSREVQLDSPLGQQRLDGLVLLGQHLQAVRADGWRALGDAGFLQQRQIHPDVLWHAAAILDSHDKCIRLHAGNDLGAHAFARNGQLAVIEREVMLGGGTEWGAAKIYCHKPTAIAEIGYHLGHILIIGHVPVDRGDGVVATKHIRAVDLEFQRAAAAVPDQAAHLTGANRHPVIGFGCQPGEIEVRCGHQFLVIRGDERCHRRGGACAGNADGGNDGYVC